MITVAQLAARLGIEGYADEDTTLQQCIDAAEAFAAAQMGRSLATATTHTEYHDAGSRYVYVDNPPIVSVTTVHEGAWPKGSNAASLVATDDLITATDDGGQNYAAGKIECTYAYTGGMKDVKVVYVGGWDTTTLPGDVKQALLELAGYYYNGPDRLFEDPGQDVPVELVSVFRRYAIRDSKAVY